MIALNYKAEAIVGAPTFLADSLNGNSLRNQSKPSLITVTVFIIGLVACSMISETVYAKTASLAGILNAVENKAPALKAAYATADVAVAERHQAVGSFFGEIDAFVHDLHFNDNRLTRPISPPINFSAMTFDKDQIGYGLSARLPIDINGRLRNSLHAASHRADAARSEAENARLSIIYGATALYRRLERIQGQRQALLKQEEALQKHVHVAEEAVRIGRIAVVEKLRLVAELKAVEGHLAGLDGLEVEVRARLASLLDISSFTDTIPAPDKQPDALSAIPGSIDNRPDIQAVRERESAAKSGVKVAWGSYVPDVFATAAWQQNQGYNGSGRDDATWEVGIQVRLPLWDGTRRIAKLHQAQAQSRAAEYHAEAQRKDANAEVVAARGAFDSARAQYGAAESALEAAEEMARIQTDRFNNGRLSATDLVDAEAVLAGVRSELTSSLVRWWQADDSLRLSLGLPPAAYNNRTTASE